VTYDPKLRMIRRVPTLGISFPQVGEPVTKYAEQNRQAHITFDHETRYKDGWLPCGDNWWRFPIPESDELVEPLPDVYVLVQGSRRKLVIE
jgi:hypothetical protein